MPGNRGKGSNPIRVAMVRCDIHAYFFAALMTRSDPHQLHRNCSLVHRLLTDPEHPEQIHTDPVPGFRIVNAWDPDTVQAQHLSETFGGNTTVCRKVEDAVDGADAAFISCCSLDGSDHLRLCQPFLKAGLPVFIDKPLASTTRDARAIVRLAETHGAALMSASMLHHADEIQFQRRRQKELAQLGLAIVHGTHGWETEGGLEGVTHGIAMALSVYGHGVDWVESMGELSREFILLHYPDGGKVLVLNMDQRYRPAAFTTHAWGYQEHCHTGGQTHVASGPVGEAQFPSAGTQLIRKFRRMVRTGKPPAPYAELLEWVKISEAAKKAHETGKRVRLTPSS